MTDEKTFLLDGQPVTFVELIEAAQREGYVIDGIAFTTEATAVLRGNGHTVEPQKDDRELIDEEISP